MAPRQGVRSPRLQARKAEVRWLIRLVGALVLLVVLTLGGLWFYLDEATQTAIEAGGEAALGVPTRVADVRVRPAGGRIEIAGVRIANPPGFSDEAFLVLADGEVEIELASLTRDVVVLPVMALSGIELRLEKKGAKANYDALLTGSDDPAPPANAGAGRGVVVRTLTIGGVTAYLDPGVVIGTRRALTVEIPEIVLRDIGSGTDGGVLTSQLSEIVIDAVLAALARKGIGLPAGLVADLRNLPLEVRGELERRAGDIQGQALKAVDETVGKALGSKLKGGAEAATRGLKSLLGGGEK